MIANRRTVRSLFTLLLVALIGASAAGPVLASGVQAEIQGGQIYFASQVNYDKLAITVSGGDRFVNKLFAASEVASFNPADYNLADGEYAYEAVLYPAPVKDTSVDQHLRGVVNARSEAIKTAGSFRVSGGLLVEPDRFATEAGQNIEENPDPNAQTILTDLIVQGSACVGFDCESNESFGFDTLRLKENNLRIKFQDTSNSASFPTNDWEITINDTGNGGSNLFAVTDVDAGRRPFEIRAGAPAAALFVNQNGNVGIDNASPAVKFQVTDGNTPVFRLDQDGSDGFGTQIWDVAGNETNFFIRDVTHSSKLPFRIKPNAPDDALYIAASGNIGLGSDSPGSALHIRRGGAGNGGLPRIRFDNLDSESKWVMDVSDNEDFRISVDGSGQQEFLLEEQGNLRIPGTLDVNNAVTGSNAGAALCIDSEGRLCACGSCS